MSCTHMAVCMLALKQCFGYFSVSKTQNYFILFFIIIIITTILYFSVKHSIQILLFYKT